jgi:hypothetical protein
VAVALFALVLSGCTSAPAYSDLDQSATAEDVLPDDLTEQAGELEPDTVRLAGRLDGNTYYLARGPESGVCVLVYRSGDDWAAACGGGTSVTVGYGGVTATVAPDGSPLLEDGEQVGNNLVISGADNP